MVRVLIAALVMLGNVPVPPKPPTFSGDKWAWERAVRRCYERPTEWAQQRCLRDLYGQR